MSLTVKNLKKSYGNKIVVDNLSFSMDKPGVYALLGTNGAGKTTSIRMMLGILAKDGGEVLWKNQPLSTDTCNVGYLAEERGLYPKYQLMEQLIYFASLKGVPKNEAKKRIRYWAERLEVTEYLYPEETNQESKKLRSRKKAKPKKADQLSKGNQQKIQFMITLLSDPELLILDEPLSGLDPVNTDIFKAIIHEEISKGKYLIMSSHQMATVEEFCNDIIIMHKSKVVLQGNLNEIKKGYGRVNLSIKTEQDIRAYIERQNAEIEYEKEYEYKIKVQNEQHANAILSSLIKDEVTIITFNLSEPSLHEIFVEKVGGEHEV